MCCPFDHSLDGLYEAKHQCGIKNNVSFLIEKDLNIAIKYVNDKYTKNYVNLQEIFTYIAANTLFLQPEYVCLSINLDD